LHTGCGKLPIFDRYGGNAPENVAEQRRSAAGTALALSGSVRDVAARLNGTAMSFTRILCPVELLPQSAHLVREAVALAEDPCATVTVMHGVEPSLLQAATACGAERSLRNALNCQLDRIVEVALRDVELPPTMGTLLTETPAHTAILDESTRRSCDLIVMGARGVLRPARGSFGSTLEHVLRCTTVPVVAVPPRSAEFVEDRGRVGVKQVVVAIDFERPSMVAASAAASYARRHGASLTLLHVMPQAPSWSARQAAVFRQHRLLRERVEHELALLARELGDAGSRASEAVLEGSPSERIAAYQQDRRDTLVVLGLRGSAGRSNGRPGAVAKGVLSASLHPVLFVPHVCTSAVVSSVSIAFTGAYTESP
jgi:nucleotide-binding universal stress UspA family protein